MVEIRRDREFVAAQAQLVGNGQMWSNITAGSMTQQSDLHLRHLPGVMPSKPTVTCRHPPTAP